MTPTVSIDTTDREAVATYLNQLAADLDQKRRDSEDATDDFHDLITYVRATTKVLVNDMADTIGRDRNYVDSVWSISERSGRTAKIQPSWFGLNGFEDGPALLAALKAGAVKHKTAMTDVADARKARDAVVTAAYASKVLGPSAIGREAAIDRNHVLRVVKKAGIPPVHRTNIRNQYSN